VISLSHTGRLCRTRFDNRPLAPDISIFNSVNSEVVCFSDTIELMNTIKVSPDLELVPPDPDRDAYFALAWFDSPYGKDTLLKMGNSESEIKKPSLEGEKKTLEEFIQLER